MPTNCLTGQLRSAACTGKPSVVTHTGCAHSKIEAGGGGGCTLHLCWLPTATEASAGALRALSGAPAPSISLAKGHEPVLSTIATHATSGHRPPTHGGNQTRDVSRCLGPELAPPCRQQQLPERVQVDRCCSAAAAAPNTRSSPESKTHTQPCIFQTARKCHLGQTLCERNTHTRTAVWRCVKELVPTN